MLARHIAPFAIILLVWVSTSMAAGDAGRGANAFRQCMACHSTKAGEHMTGPSLAHIWGQKAGTVEGFARYSDALKHSGVTWNEQTLNKWLANPAAFVPGNAMGFPGLKSENARQDIISYLKAVSEAKAPAVAGRGGGTMGGGMMGGGMMPGGMRSGGQKLNLKSAPPEGQVTSIERCRDTYTIKTADGKTSKIWEFNLRLKTDSSSDGPAPGKPVVVGAGMMGDRASVIFASPAEISAQIKESCP